MHLRVRKKKNKSGSVSVYIVDRSNRGYKVIENLGCSSDADKIEYLYNKALNRIDELQNNLLIFSRPSKKEQLRELLSTISTQDIISRGDELVFGRIFDAIGCSDIFSSIGSKGKIRKKEEKDFLFRSLVLSRIIYPGSKLELIHYRDILSPMKCMRAISLRDILLLMCWRSSKIDFNYPKNLL